MKKFTILMMTFCLCASTALFAADGTWNVEGDGDWSTAGNWTSSIIADGASSIAFLNNNFSGDWVGAPRAINVDSPRTIGQIYFGSAGSYWNFWSLTTGTITLDNGGSTPIISVNGIWASMIDSLAGTAGFNKTGADDLRLYAEQSISGPVTISAGTLGAYGDTALKNADVNVNGGRLTIGGNVSASLKSLTVTSGDGNVGLIKPEAGQSATLNTPFTTSYTDAGNTFVVNVDADSELTLNSNVTMSANTAFAISANNGTLNINAPISGPYSLRLMGRSATEHIGTYNINAPCTYTGWTTLESWGANPRFELGVNQAFPVGGFSTELRLQVDNSSADTSVTLDMNDKTQKVSKLVVVLDGAQTGHSAEIAGSAAGVIEITNVFWTTASVGTTLSLTGGKIIFNGPGLSLNMPLTIANATLLNNGSWWSGTDAKFILQAGAKIGGTGMLAWDGGDSTNLIITAGATITPGQSIGEVGCWNLEMLDGSEYDWEVGDTTADKVYARGVLDISDGGITVNVIDAGSPNDTFTLFQADGGIIGNATDITMSYGPGVAGPVNPTIVGNTIVADIVPEPATLGLLSLLALAFLRRK